MILSLDWTDNLLLEKLASQPYSGLQGKVFRDSPKEKGFCP